MRGWSVENGMYGREWNDDLSGGPLSRKPIPKGDHLLGCNVNHQSETRKRQQCPRKHHIIKSSNRCNKLKLLKYRNDTHHNT
jgi:hypothetical protein